MTSTIATVTEKMTVDAFAGPYTLTLSDVNFRSVLHDIRAAWGKGQMVGIIGPNGAGKSTLLRLLAGVWAQSSGTILLNGQPLEHIPAKVRAREIAYLPQQISEECPFTVQEFVEMGRYIHRTRWGALTKSGRQVVERAIEQMGLTKYRDVPLNKLSGGERQRAGVARCLAQESKILLLDEPISNLDVYYQMDILSELQTLARQRYLIILSIHHLEFAARYCSQLLLLQQGTVYAQGAVDDVLTETAVRDVFDVETNIYRDPFGQYLRFSYRS